MTNEFNNNFQYDNCAAQGICSVNPRSSSLQEVLTLYLQAASYYALKLLENNICNLELKWLILNTISVIISNPEFSETDFKAIVSKFNEYIPKVIKEYEKACQNRGKDVKYLKTALKFNKKNDITKFIQIGEKEFLKKSRFATQEIRNMYKIIFVLAKSICANIFDLESFNVEEKDGYLTILNLINSLNNETSQEKVKKLIQKASIVDRNMIEMLRQAQIKNYGEQKREKVSFSTTPSKAILVVGSNLKELEEILEAVNGTEIDIYTHDEMMLAHTFPKFSKYKNLKGQYGQELDNCLLDFATFPGPIVLTQHSLYNVEHLYRGLLYSTDFVSAKGVIQIKNKDFSPVIKAAQEAKGFKTGRQSKTIDVGFVTDEVHQIVLEKLSKNSYSNIFIIGLGRNSQIQQTYFEKFLKFVPDDVLVISLSHCQERENIVCLNAHYDSYALINIAEFVLDNSKFPITIFFPECDKHSIAKMIYFSLKSNVKIYAGQCVSIILNPNLMETLKNIFQINSISSPKKDLETILKDD